MWQLCADLLVLWALVILGRHRRAPALVGGAGTRSLAIVVAIVIGLFAHHYAVGGWDIWGGLESASAPPRFPAMRIAVPASVVMTAAPHLSVPFRRLGHWIIGHRRAGRGDGQRDVADRQPGRVC